VPPIVKDKIRKRMSSKKNELYCGDTLNTLRCENQEFRWSRAYNYYKALSPAEKENNLIWTSGITLAGCVPEVIDFKEIVQWCQTMQLQGHQPISLSPLAFSRKL
jgi:hypothetical protein